MTRLLSCTVAVGLAAASAAAALWTAPARAGDDCSYATVEGWEVVYDRTCDREITRRIDGLFVSVGFAGTPTQPNIVRLSASPNPASIAVNIGKRRLATTTATAGHRLAGAALREIVTAMRQRRALTFTLTPTAGAARTVVVDGAGFEAAYQRMIR
ncbi:MAG: hypothetical protein ACREBO_08775 [Novosphingobium sp.]